MAHMKSNNSSVSKRTFNDIRVVPLSECQQAAQCLADAFATDEVARYFLDPKDMAGASEAAKWKLHCEILEYIVAAHCISGLVTTTGPNYDAVALW